jgi:hypothetical protein
MDRDYGDVRPFQCLYLAARRFPARFQDKYIFKFFDDGSEMVEKELKMMILAGDCSATPSAGYSREGNCMASSCRTKHISLPPLDRQSYMHLPPHFSRNDKLRFINQLRILVSGLHEKGIIHERHVPTDKYDSATSEMRQLTTRGTSLVR